MFSSHGLHTEFADTQDYIYLSCGFYKRIRNINTRIHPVSPNKLSRRLACGTVMIAFATVLPFVFGV